MGSAISYKNCRLRVEETHLQSTGVPKALFFFEVVDPGETTKGFSLLVWVNPDSRVSKLFEQGVQAGYPEVEHESLLSPCPDYQTYPSSNKISSRYRLP